MSIFSRISKSRQQAKEHNARLVEQQKKESSNPPYRHVVTHAAIDAITSAPPSWREADRVRIKEENNRRRTMAANHHMSLPGTPGMPRVSSSLSHVSFPADANADPVVRLPRAQSYSGVPSYPYVPYLSTPPNVSPTHYHAVSPDSPTFKGKEVYRPGHETLRKGHGESGSSSGSSSSQDDLDMAHGQPKQVVPQVVHQPGHVVYSTRPTHRFHPSQSSIDRIAMANNGRARESSRPPTAMSNMAPDPTAGHSRGSHARPASMGSRQDLYGQMNNPSGLPSPPATSPPSPVRHLVTHAPVPVHVPVRMPYEGQVQTSYESARFPDPKPLDPGAETAKADCDDDSSLSDISFKSAELPPSPSPSPPPAQRAQATAQAPTQAPAHAPAYMYASAPAPTPASAPAPALASTAPAVKEHCIVNMFPEAELGPETGKTTKRLSKSGKKSRWSHSRSAPVHVI